MSAARGVLVLFFVATPALATCYQTTVQPSDPPYIPPGTVTHQAYGLTDPAGQQTARFDLFWGGTLASLAYNGVEMMWGGDPGAMIQPAWFYYPSAAGFPYDPEQAGGPSLAGTPTLGAGCLDANTLFLLSATTDYFGGAGGYRVANPVLLGAIAPDQFTTPYTIATTARFVSNPGGTPAYYLRLTQTIINNHQSELLAVGGGIALYVPYAFQNGVVSPPQCRLNAMCSISSTPKLVVGMYPNISYTAGTALFIRPSQWSSIGATQTWGETGVPIPGDTRGASAGANIRFWALPPKAAETYDVYVLVGDWASALNFVATQ
jgi:hypothetical protein